MSVATATTSVSIPRIDRVWVRRYSAEMDERDDSAGGAPRPEREREVATEGERAPRSEERTPRAADRERADRERAERERAERGERAERERAEWLERERAERVDRAERERGDRERADRAERERMERERAERERFERDRGNDLPESLRQRLEAMVPDMVKRTFTAGLGALFSTEENLRKLAKDITIPDVAGYLASTADSTKDKVLEIVAREVRDFLEHVNLSEEVAKLLTTLSFEVRTEIRFVPNSERYSGVDPSVKASVRLKRNDKAVGGGVGGGAPANDEERGSRLRFWRRGSTAGGGDAEGARDEAEDETEAEPDDERTVR
jgi:hypothetical protein